MNELTAVMLPLILGLASGFIGGIATGGGMLAIPSLIFMGLSPVAAIATTSLVGFSTVTSALKFHRAKVVDSRRALPFIVIGLVGSVLGASLLPHINNHFMQKAFGVVCLMLAVAIALDKNASVRPRTRTRDALGFALTCIASVLVAIVGTGGGIFMLYICTYFYGMAILQASATSRVMALGGVPASIAVLTHEGLINYHVGVPLAIGSAVGGYLGAHTAIKKGDARVKRIFLAIVILSGLKLLLS
jgi:uncharacterized membrane protein YfcA